MATAALGPVTPCGSWVAGSAPDIHPAATAPVLRNRSRSDTMNWTKPQATDLRYGFEITMYISAR